MKKLILLATFHLLLHAAEQKLTLPDLLKQHPEQELYDLVDWRQRFRQKYLFCEYEPLKSQLASIAPCLMQHIKDQQWDEIFKDYNPQSYDQKMHDHMNLVATVAQKINHTQLLQEIKKRIGNNWHLAARYGLVDLINELISSTTIDLGGSISRRTALHFACEMGHAKVVRVLLAAQATVDSLDTRGYAPLMVAARAGHVKCCQLLLESKANVNMRNHDGRTALSYAAAENKSDVVQLLLDYKADPNLADTCMETPLMNAACKGHYDCAQKLIQAGANLNDLNRYSYIALDTAIYENIKRVLIQAGAKKIVSIGPLSIFFDPDSD